MRIISRFQLKIPELPKDYRPIFVSFFKNVLMNYNEVLAKQYYNDQDPIMKSFTFSILLEKPDFLAETIVLNSNTITLLVSTPDPKDGMILYSAIANSKKKTFPLPNNNEMKITKILLPKLPEIKTNEIFIKMLSPLILRHHNKETNKDTYLDYTSENFIEKAEEIIKWQISNYKPITNPDILFNDFSIAPIKPQKTVITAFGQSLNASLGIYKLTGHPVLLNFLYLSGIGSRRNQGFGAFEILA